MTAGTSKRPLIEKLGIRAGFRVSLQNEPDQYISLLGPLPEGVALLSDRATQLDSPHVFATNRRQLNDAFPRAKWRIKPGGTIWVSWPKMTSPLRGDLKENVVRDVGLANGLVDVKVAAIDEDWSGLKFVFRVEHRP